MTATTKNKFIYWFDEIGKEDVGLVGGKGANLGEMTKMKLPVPPGFFISAKAYFYFLEENKLNDRIRKILSYLLPDDPQTYQIASTKIKKLFEESRMPRDLS
jgi:pyruvate,water dikinase